MGKTKFQIFLENLVHSALSLFKIIVLSDFSIRKVTSGEKISDDCVVLGNGRSLKDQINDNKDFLEQNDLFVVNFFWKSAYYEVLKPRYYMILSTNYWSDGKIDNNNEDRLKTFDKIAEKTKWEMTLFVPSIAKRKNEWSNRINENKKIKIVYLNTTPIEGFKSFMFFCFRRNFGMPRPHNVLIPSIKIAIELKYKNIFLFGADHSWLKDVYVAENNNVYLTQKHFYDENKAKPEEMYQGITNKTRNLAQVLMKFVYSFNSYYILNEYATKNNIKILNATKDSYIDAFERVDLSKN